MKVKYIDYYITDSRTGLSPWRTVICFETREDAEKAAEILVNSKLNIRKKDIEIYNAKLVIKKYVLEWRILRALRRGRRKQVSKL